MKATELRIWNYVYDHDLELCKIVSIHENGRIRVELPNVEDVPLGSFNAKFAKGIPLTEEILLKCGFEKFKGWDDMNFWKLKGAEHSERFELFETARGYESPSGKIIESVHTLQNCFYFHEMTGEELNIEL